MRRKYDLRNKRNFVIILILSVAIIGIFSLFIYRYVNSSKIEYAIEIGSVIQDDNKNFINIEEDAKLKIRWSGNYYLMYQDKSVNLSKKVIVYNTVTGKMNLYGKFYEITSDGEIIESNDETSLANTTDTKFYKLGDREYLLIDRQIVSDDRSIETSNYMLVELDKMGNAKLSNNKLNLKTINPTVLITSAYKFDIANEILTFDTMKIDLKKIIGSTNQYVASTNISKNGSGSGTASENGGGENGNGGTGNGAYGNGSGGAIYGGTGQGIGNVINNTDSGNVTDIGEIKNKTKMTSIVRAQEGLTQIDVDYVIYDPYSEYKTVYAEIEKPGEIEVVYLSKNDTHIVFDNLLANTEYKINFVYTTVNEETNEIVPTTFDSLTLTTRKPVYNISVYKVSNVANSLSYKVVLQDGYPVSKVNVVLSFKERVVDLENDVVTLREVEIPSSVDVSGGNTVFGTISLTGYDISKDSLLTLKIVSVENGYGKMDIDSVYTFRLGR